MIRTLATTRARGKTMPLAFLLVALTIMATGIADAAPTNFIVTNTNDSGEGSLRQAISDANGNANPSEVDTINFDIPASDPNCDATGGVCTISPSTELPYVTEAVTINGYSQPGSSPNTLATGSNADLEIELSGASAGAGAFGITMNGSNNVVKGLIVNRWPAGVVSFASGNRIEGNYIGTDASGTTDLGNLRAGVFIGGSNNVVGGTSAGARNLISGNSQGVEVTSFATNNRIEGNYIGTDASGATKVSNGIGVFIEGTNNVVGGTSAAARNLISGNGDGVKVNSDRVSDAKGNRILRNSISDNSRLGIDLVGGTENASRVSANDAGDADVGANNLQNYPVITSATTWGGQTTIQGTLNSTPNDAFDLRFYSSLAADPSGFGEGETYAGQTNVVANAGGNAAFSFTTNTPIGGGQIVTATATNTVTNDTSEFSEAVEVEDTTPPPPPAPQCSDGADNDMDGKVDFGGANADPGCTSATDDSESPDPPPDTTAPTVTGVTPAEGALEVPRLTNVTATFSEEVGPDTVKYNVTLVNGKIGSQVQATVTLGADGKTVTLVPTEALVKNTRYEARIIGGTGGVKDLAGNPLAADKVWSFTTAKR